MLGWGVKDMFKQCTIKNDKILICILCDNFLTVQDKKIDKRIKFLKKCEGTVVKI